MRKGSGQSDTQKKLQERQLSEIEKLESIEAQQTLAAKRRTRGRASLISGSERGIVENDTLGTDAALKRKKPNSLLEGAP